jgi:hypothetical protein
MSEAGVSSRRESGYSSTGARISAHPCFHCNEAPEAVTTCLKRECWQERGNGSVLAFVSPQGELGLSSPLDVPEPYDGEGSQDEGCTRKGRIGGSEGLWQSLDRLKTPPTMKFLPRGPSTTGADMEGPL